MAIGDCPDVDIEVETAAVASEEPGEELAFTEEEEEAPASTARDTLQSKREFQEADRILPVKCAVIVPGPACQVTIFHISGIQGSK